MSRVKETTSEWVALEEKVADNVGPFGGRSTGSRQLTVLLPGKGKKGKGRRMKLQIPRSMIPEVKRITAYFWDAQYMKNPAVDTTASRYMILTDIVQGTGSSNRLGDAIFVEKVVLRFYFNGTSQTTFQISNGVVFADNEPAAAVPNWADLFTGIGVGNTGLYDVAVPEQDERFRFKMLREFHNMHFWSAAYYNAGAFAAVRPIFIELEIPIKRRVMYDSTQAKPVAGCDIGVMGWSDMAGGATLWPQGYASYQVFFRDC